MYNVQCTMDGVDHSVQCTNKDGGDGVERGELITVYSVQCTVYSVQIRTGETELREES